MPLAVECLAVGPLETNCYLVWREGAESKSCAVIDPGGEPGRIRKAVERRSLLPEVILLTHCHGDHIGAVAKLKGFWPEAALCAPAGEEELLASPAKNLSLSLGSSIRAPGADRLLRDGDVVRIGGDGEEGFSLRVIGIPGHSPDGLAFCAEGEDAAPPLLFSGDILFAGSVGRVDLPGGDATQLIRGIKSRLFKLPAKTRVLPGHGPETEIGREKATNPFIG